MKRFLCNPLPSDGHSIELNEEESHHARTVLRVEEGDRAEAISGAGTAVLCQIEFHKKTIRLAKVGPLRSEHPKAICPIALEVAVLKGDSMDWVIEKAVELGARSLTPLVTERTVVQIDKKGPEAFRTKWQKAADQALKQCGRLTSLKIDAPISIATHMVQAPSSSDFPRIFLDENLDADRADQTLPALLLRLKPKQIRLVIGPEGGWGDQEKKILASGGTPATLGPLVLRAETATLSALALGAQHFRSQP